MNRDSQSERMQIAADRTSADPRNAYISIGLDMEQAYNLMRKFREVDYDAADWDPMAESLGPDVNWMDVLGLDEMDFPVDKLPIWVARELDRVALTHYLGQIEAGTLDWRR